MKKYSVKIQVLKGVLFGCVCIFTWIYLHFWLPFSILIYMMLCLLDDILEGYVFGLEDMAEGGYTLTYSSSEQAEFNLFRHLGFELIVIALLFFIQTTESAILFLIGLFGVVDAIRSSNKLREKERI